MEINTLEKDLEEAVVLVWVAQKDNSYLIVKIRNVNQVLSLPSNMINAKTLSFWCPVGMLTKILEDVHCPERSWFRAQKGPFWVTGAMKRPVERPNGHLPENRRYPELPQDMGDL